MALGYVNDPAYAAALVQKRLRQGRGRRLIGQELGSKGISDEMLGEALGTIETEEELRSAVDLAGRLVRRHEAEPPARRREKVLAALARRGFSGHVGREALARALEDAD
ncbi:MAG: regulatory protein RecX [Candidatus Dormibacteria bacterium]